MHVHIALYSQKQKNKTKQTFLTKNASIKKYLFVSEINSVVMSPLSAAVGKRLHRGGLI